MTSLIAVLTLFTIRILIPLLILLSIGEAVNRHVTKSNRR
jgi:hypothetical protein